MGLINCNSLLSVGVEQFDAEHCQLVAITNQLHEAIKAGSGAQAVQTTLQQLSEFAVRHFQAEEQLLEQHGFPRLAEHQRAHQEILDKLSQFQIEYQDTVQPMQHSMMQFLLDWLTGHTKTVDKQYGPFLNSKGVY
jgi:hemerythrin